MLEHRFAQLVAACTFLLLIIGGMVNATGSSLACPEAVVICHGSIMPNMIGGVLYEHGHRLAAMTVGLLQIALTILLFLRRRDLRGLAVVTLLMVIAQGMLGAVTVKYKLPWYVSTMHLLLAMSYFATLLYVAWRTRPAQASAWVELGRARRWIQIAVGALFVQLLLGALVRHSEATLACIGMPTCTLDGEWFPEALTQRVHMIHRTWGCITAILTTIAAIRVYQAAAGWPALRRLMLVAPVLVAVQITLGVYVVLTYRSVPVAVAHFAGAVSLWALWFTALLWTREQRAVAVLAPVRGIHAVP